MVAGGGRLRGRIARCITDLSAMPEAGALLSEAKILLPQIAELIEAQAAKDHAEEDVDPKRIADWSPSRRKRTALCEEAPK